jgi:hypothetical protein
LHTASRRCPRWRALQWATGAADRPARQTGFPVNFVAKKEANRLRHSLYPIRKAVPSSTIARSTVMTHSALREGNTEETDGEPVRVALMTPAKPERRNAPRRRYRKLPLDIQHFHWKPPFVTRRNTAARPASCELAAEQVTNAASASRTSSADTFLAG